MTGLLDLGLCFLAALRRPSKVISKVLGAAFARREALPI